MDEFDQDCYVVFVRDSERGDPHLIERQLVSCGSYEEARWVRREYGQKSRDVIIRYVGVAGGELIVPSLTINVTVNVPLLAYVWLGFTPLPVVPSPKFHE